MAGYFLVGALLGRILGGSGPSVVEESVCRVDDRYRVRYKMSDGTIRISNHSFSTKEEAEDWRKMGQNSAIDINASKCMSTHIISSGWIG